MSDLERPMARPACEQLDLRPAGGDLVPDRSGLASQSAACLPPEFAKVIGAVQQWATEPNSTSPFDEAYAEIDEEGQDGKKASDLLANMNMDRINLDGLGMGPASLWVLGTKFVPRLVPLLNGAVSGKGPAPNAKGASGKRPAKASELSKAEGEIMTLATSGSCPELFQKWANGVPTSTTGVRLRFGHVIGDHIVIEQRLASFPRKFLVSVFSRDGRTMKEEDVMLTVRREVWRLGGRNANLAEIKEFVKSLGSP